MGLLGDAVEARQVESGADGGGPVRAMPDGGNAEPVRQGERTGVGEPG